MFKVMSSSLMPRSSEIAWPPVRIAMSWSIVLRRSPKPGAFTAATFRPPRSLLTTRVGEGLALHFLGNDDEGSRGLHHGLQERQQLLQSGQASFRRSGCRDHPVAVCRNRADLGDFLVGGDLFRVL